VDEEAAVTCTACGAGNRPGAKFCRECGAVLAVTCPACGAPSESGQRFCDQCGSALAPGTAVPAPAVARDAPASERRLVSVLFADLVGFTPLSETRDAEEVRELLSRYFDSCRRIVERYGGTVEKFIGDALMAVWGTPAAQEDDAERAVRAALDVVAAVPQLDPGLQGRAGVLTGEAAVTLGAAGEGMVAGDLVNTASRVQAAAEPGTVLVGEATKRATEAAIAYEAAGAHDLKGKAEAVPLFRALRVTASRGGALKTEALEPPFVGRERELRLVKELFHASTDEGKAHLVTVTGIAGIGKSRLAWEFEKYADGLVEEVYWHRGRCLAYGEGVAYWALAEMVRMRARISEEDSAGSALEKLRATLAEHVADPEERAWLEPRLAHLLALAERTAPDREDLFSAWRLFFERLAEHNAAMLVFEDLQWADAALLDFVEYLLEWSRNHRIFVLALTRPELLERRPAFGSGARNSTILALEPLSPRAMEELLDGFVPGLPADLRARILERAEGIPLYAVETVRMLLDRGLLERRGDVYRLTGAVEALEVPETLHALIAARLDGLSPEERRVLQDAAVLGKSFTKAGLSTLSGLGDAELEPILTALVRKEILSVQADPRSPERGQYTFLQDLLKRVAYETLAKKDRKARHLAAAAHLERTADLELIEVIAAHYLDAYRTLPDAEDAPELKAEASERLALAGERAASLAANEEARSSFEQAAELADDPLRRAELLERAGTAATATGPFDLAVDLFERAVELYHAEGATHAAARVSAWLGWATWIGGDLERGSELLEQAFEVLADEEPDADLAALAEARARLRFFLGDSEGAAERVERALEIAEALYVPAVLVDALNTKHLVLHNAGREEEALALLQRAIELGRRHDFGAPLARALYNFSYQMAARDDFVSGRLVDEECIEHARRRGDRVGEQMAMGHLVTSLFMLGEWDEAERALAQIEPGIERNADDRIANGTPLLVARGDVAAARGLLEEHPSLRTSDEVQHRRGYLFGAATVLRGEGRPVEALAAVREALDPENRIAARHPFSKWTLLEGVSAALDAGELEVADDLLGEWQRMRPVDRTPFLEAHHARFEARLAAARGEADEVGPGFRRAVEGFRGLGTPFYLGQALLEQAEWLAEQGRGDEAEPLLAEAREIFGSLRATPWLERATRTAVGRQPEPVA
jgi:class 3 adenylate cyclase/tetratricopeptide (TPR) repeat protein